MGQLKFGPGHGFSFLLPREIDISRRGRGGNVGPDWVGIQARWKEGEIQSLNFPRFPRGGISTALSSRYSRSATTPRVRSSPLAPAFLQVPSGLFSCSGSPWGLVLTQNFAPGGPREEDFGVPRPEMPLLLAPSCPRAFCTSAAAHLDAVSVVHWSVENAVGQVGHGDQEPTRFRPERRLLTPERL